MSNELDLWNPDTFTHALKLGNMFKDSTLIPPHLRGKLPDVTVALLMARRMQEDPLIVMQNIYVVSGKAGWSAQYIIARANRSGVFKGRINWRESGKGDTLEVTAFAKLAETGDEVSFPVSMAMARAENWTKNEKYKSMPQLMLRYRSATLLVRLYAPEVMLGYPTSDEIEDTEPQRATVTMASTPPAAIPAIEDAGTRTGQLSAMLGDEPEEVAPVQTATPTNTSAAPADSSEEDDGDSDAPTGSDPERDQLLARIAQAEKRLGNRGVQRARGEVGLSPNPRLARAGTPKLKAYLDAMSMALDELELMGGEE